MNRSVTIVACSNFFAKRIDDGTRLAIGYLASWAIQNDRYRNVSIYGRRNGDLHANYYDKDNEITYSILAQRREDGSYSYNS